MPTWPRVLAALAIWFLLTSMVAGAEAALALLLTCTLFALPGIPLVRAMTGVWSWSHPLPLLAGLLNGIVLSALLNASIAVTLGWSSGLSAMGIVVLTVGLYMIVGRKKPSDGGFVGPTLDRSDIAFLGIVTVLMLVAIAVPLSNVGEIIQGRHHYYSLFAQDYLMRGSFSMAVLRELPPDDMFLAPERMHSYFLFYSVMAYAMDVVSASVAPDRLVAAADMIVPIFLLISFYLLASVFLDSRRVVRTVVAIGIFAYSYKGFYVLFKRVFLPLSAPAYSFFESRGFLSFSDVSYGWYRDFLVEPHSAFALTLLIVFLSIEWTRNRDDARPLLAVCSGALLAGSFASDSFVGLIGLAWFVLNLGLDLMHGRSNASAAIRYATLVLGGFGVCVAVSLAVGLCSVGSESSRLLFSPYWTVWKLAPALFPLVLGPSLLLGGLGLWVLWKEPGLRERYNAFASVLLLLVLSALVGLLVQHNDPTFQDVVFRKSIKIMEIPLLLFSGVALASGFVRGGRLGSRLVWAVVIGLGFTTLCTVLAALSGFYDAGQTSTVSEADFEACAWLRENTPRESIVQSLPEQSEGAYYEISPVAMLAGRAMALGNFKMARLSSPSQEAFRATRYDIEFLFRSRDLEAIVVVLEKYCIDYVYIGPSERAFGGDQMMSYASYPDRFMRVYSENGVQIFRVLREASRSSCPS